MQINLARYDAMRSGHDDQKREIFGLVLDGVVQQLGARHVRDEDPGGLSVGAPTVSRQFGYSGTRVDVGSPEPRRYPR
jgi:hypothetical protein